MTFAKSKIPGSHGYDPPAEMQAALRALLMRLGESATLKALDTDRLTVARILGGMSVSRGTLLAIEQAMANAPKQDDRQLSFLAA